MGITRSLSNMIHHTNKGFNTGILVVEYFGIRQNFPGKPRYIFTYVHSVFRLGILETYVFVLVDSIIKHRF